MIIKPTFYNKKNKLLSSIKKFKAHVQTSIQYSMSTLLYLKQKYHLNTTNKIYLAVSPIWYDIVDYIKNTPNVTIDNIHVVFPSLSYHELNEIVSWAYLTKQITKEVYIHARDAFFSPYLVRRALHDVPQDNRLPAHVSFSEKLPPNLNASSSSSSVEGSPRSTGSSGSEDSKSLTSHVVDFVIEHKTIIIIGGSLLIVGTIVYLVWRRPPGESGDGLSTSKQVSSSQTSNSSTSKFITNKAFLFLITFTVSLSILFHRGTSLFLYDW